MRREFYWLILLFFLIFSFNIPKIQAIGPVGPWQLVLQKIVEEIFQKMFEKALSSGKFESVFEIWEAKAKFDEIYNEQKGKLERKQEAERTRLQNKFNEKWSNEKATGTIEERMERAGHAKEEEEETFQDLREKHQREEQELEEAYQWIIEHYISKRYSEYLEKLKNAKLQYF